MVNIVSFQDIPGEHIKDECAQVNCLVLFQYLKEKDFRPLLVTPNMKEQAQLQACI